MNRKLGKRYLNKQIERTILRAGCGINELQDNYVQSENHNSSSESDQADGSRKDAAKSDSEDDSESRWGDNSSSSFITDKNGNKRPKRLTNPYQNPGETQNDKGKISAHEKAIEEYN